MKNTQGNSTRLRRRNFTLGRNRGVTLIELGFVVGIIAIIVVAVLAIYNAVKSAQEVTDATQDVAAIRQAVAQWSGGGPLREDNPNLFSTAQIDRVLGSWVQLAEYLPGNLGKQAANTPGPLLEDVNNWPNGTYQFTVDAESPYLWTLEITQIPDGSVQTLAMRLEEGAEDVLQAAGMTVTVQYRL